MKPSRNNLFWILIFFLAAALLLFAETVFTDGIPFPAHTDAFVPWSQDLSEREQKAVMARMNRSVTDKNFSFHPDNQVAHAAFKEGRLPLWNPYIMAGLPYLGQSLYGVFYPLNLPLFLFSPTRSYTPLTVFHFFLAGFFTYLLLRRFGLSQPAALAGGLIFMGCGNMTARFHYYMTFYPMVYAPLLLYLTDRFHKQRSLLSLAGLSAVTALVILSGFQQMAIYLIYMTGLFSLFCAAQGRYQVRWKRGLTLLAFVAGLGLILSLAGIDPLLVYSLGAITAVLLFFMAGSGFVQWIKAALPTVAALLVGMGLSAVQMAPVIALLPHSMRNLLPPETMVNDLNLPAGGLLGLLFPLLLSDPMWSLGGTAQNLPGMTFLAGRIPIFNHVENSIYLGILPLAFLLLKPCWKEQGRKLLFFSVAALGFLCIGLGLFWIIYPIWLLPGYQSGDPRRSLMLFSFFASITAAYGFDRLIKGQAGKSWPRIVAAVLIVLSLGAGLTAGTGAQTIAEKLRDQIQQGSNDQSEPLTWHDSAGQKALAENTRHIEESLLVFALTAAAAGMALYLLTWKPGRPTYALVMAVLISDLAAVSWHINGPQDAERFLASHPALAAMQPEQPDDHFRIFRYTDGARQGSRIPLPGDMAIHFKLEDCEGYVVQPLKRYFALLNTVQPNPPIAAQAPAVWPISNPRSLTSPILDLVGVRFLLANREVPPELGFEKIYDQNGVFVFQNSEAFPRAFMTTRARFIDPADPDPATEALRQILALGTDLRHEAVLEAKPFDLPSNTRALPEASVHYPRPERVEIELDGPSPKGVLILTDSYAPGWKAEVDGNPTKVMPAYHALRAVEVPAGARKIVFKYDPPSETIGLYISLVSLLLVLGFSLYALKRWKTK